MIEANTQKATVADSGLDWVANTDKGASDPPTGYITFRPCL